MRDTLYSMRYAHGFVAYCFVVALSPGHGDVIKWKHLPRYWPFVRGIHWSPVNSHHKGQWRGALMFSLICAWTNDWANNRQAGDLRRNHAHYDATVMNLKILIYTLHWCRWVFHRNRDFTTSCRPYGMTISGPIKLHKSSIANENMKVICTTLHSALCLLIGSCCIWKCRDVGQDLTEVCS